MRPKKAIRWTLVAVGLLGACVRGGFEAAPTEARTDGASEASATDGGSADGGSFNAWPKHFGDSEDDMAFGLVVDSAGNVTIAGAFKGVLRLDGATSLTSAGREDLYICSFDVAGRLRWARSFGGVEGDSVHALAIGPSGDLFVTGNYNNELDLGGPSPLPNLGPSSEAFVARFDGQGRHVWSTAFGGGQQSSHELAIGAGGLAVGGTFFESADFISTIFTSRGERDVFLLRFDLSGQHLWSRQGGGIGKDLYEGLAIDSKGDTIAVGSLANSADYGLGALSSAGGRDIVMVRYDLSGAVTWNQRFGGPDDDEAVDVAVTANDGFVVVGSFRQLDFGQGLLTSHNGLNTDAFVALFDAANQNLWTRVLGGNWTDDATAVAVADSGDIAVAGHFHTSADLGGGVVSSRGSYDTFASVFDAAGTFRWQVDFGGAGDERGVNVDRGIQSMAFDGSELVTAGNFVDPIEVSDQAMTSAGLMDVFAAKFAAP